MPASTILVLESEATGDASLAPILTSAGYTVTRTTDPGVYSVDLGTDVSKCQVSATIAGTGATPGTVTVTPGASTNLLTVSTFDTAATPAPANRPFNLLVAC